MLQRRASKTKNCCEFEHITCAAETNSLVNFVQMVIEVACNSFHHHTNTIKSTTLHLRPKTYKVLDFTRSFSAVWMFVCPNRNSNPAVKINTVSADFQRNCLRCFQQCRDHCIIISLNRRLFVNQNKAVRDMFWNWLWANTVNQCSHKLFF